MKTEVIEYQCDNQKLIGQLFYNEEVKEKKPVIIIAHAWKGCDQFAHDKAKMFADQGYLAFAADLYGEGTVVTSDEDAFNLMLPLFLDRKLLRKRIVSAYQTATKHSLADSDRVGAVGFCFGGATVLELLRSGVLLKGVVSVHGLLGDSIAEKTAKIEPAAENLHGSLLLLHGYQDPMVSLNDRVQIEKEFSEKRIDWQMHVYGSATHAFTNPEANSPENGLLYDPASEKRALRSIQDFYQEVFV